MNYIILISSYVLFSLFFVGCKPPAEEAPEKEVLKTTENEKNNTSVSPQLDPKVQQFWQLVAQQNVKEAIGLANSLVTENTANVNDVIKEMFSKEGIKESVLTRKEFNEIDFYFWSQAQFFYSVLNDLKKESTPDNIVLNVFNKVNQQIAVKGDGEDLSVYPIDIWHRKYGVCDRQTWVFCEIIRQLGAEVSIIYLYDEEKKTYPHTIAEIYYNGNHYIIDELYNFFLPKTKFTDLTPEKIALQWKDHPELHNTFKKAIRVIPSMPIDYSERNQRLCARLMKIINFGVPPQMSYQFWKKNYPEQDIRFWDYSIRLLKTMSLYQDVEK